MLNKKNLLLAGILGLACVGMVGCNQKNEPPKENNDVQQEQQQNSNNENNKNENTENKDEVKGDEAKNEELKVSKFIPNTSYNVKFQCSDLGFDVSSIKGDGTYYQRMGTTGKGDYVEVFKYMNNNLINTYASDFERSNYKEDFNDLNFFGEENTSNKIYLNSPIKQGTEWDKMKIVEVGKNLKLEKIQLEGDYVVVERDISTEGINAIETLYFSQGLGIVKDVTKIDGDIVDYSELISYEEVK